MKRIVAGMLGLLLCAGGAGCQPTPAAEPVPYQGHDPVDNAPSAEASEKIDAPPRVENSFTDAATGLTVIFDCEVKTPEVSGYSILAAKAVQLSPADFAAAIEALCPGRPLLQAPVRTQAEWGAYITRCKQNLGESDPAYIQYLTEQMMNAPQAYEPVPFHLEDIGAGEAFEAYFPGEEGAYGVLSGTMGGNSFYYSRDQEAGCIGEDDLEPGLDDAMLGDYQGEFPLSAQEALPYARAALAALGQADAEQAYVGKMCAYAYGGLYVASQKINGLFPIDDKDQIPECIIYMRGIASKFDIPEFYLSGIGRNQKIFLLTALIHKMSSPQILMLITVFGVTGVLLYMKWLFVNKPKLMGKERIALIGCIVAVITSGLAYLAQMLLFNGALPINITSFAPAAALCFCSALIGIISKRRKVD